jgi:hypothetical protein
MVLRFAIQDTGIMCGYTSASLTGQTFQGLSIIGSSPILSGAGAEPQEIPARKVMSNKKQ